ncbi:hypothetical protein NL676_024882 [Syzygium grande]|nr:hypothetical protein NL676_024882 [Syzygium grande]
MIAALLDAALVFTHLGPYARTFYKTLRLFCYPTRCLYKKHTASPNASLSVENLSDVLVSPSSAFSAGFFPVGRNAYAFAIWFSDPPTPAPNAPLSRWPIFRPLSTTKAPPSPSSTRVTTSSPTVATPAAKSGLPAPAPPPPLSSTSTAPGTSFSPTTAVSSCGGALTRQSTPSYLSDYSPETHSRYSLEAGTTVQLGSTSSTSTMTMSFASSPTSLRSRACTGPSLLKFLIK